MSPDERNSFDRDPTSRIELHPRLREVYEKARLLPADAQAKFVSEHCSVPAEQALILILLSGLRAESWKDKQVGEFTVRNLVGSGGFGDVYKAIANQTSKVVAIKFLRRPCTDEARDAFFSEMRILAQLNHPNIVSLVGSGESPDGTPYYAMEYVEGWTLSKYCEMDRRPIEDRLKLFQQVCEAVHHAHGKQIIHRDLKPSNIRVNTEGRIKLLDFGIALASRSDWGGKGLAESGRAVGTLVYASPEQVSGEMVTASADIYSLGVILFELLTSKLPFDRRDAPREELIRTICEGRPVRMSAAVDRNSARLLDRGSVWGLRRRLRGDLDAIVVRAMLREPRKRYASAALLAADIQCYLDHRPISIRAWRPIYRARLFARRHRAFAVSLVIILISVWAVGIESGDSTPHPQTVSSSVPPDRSPATLARMYLLGKSAARDYQKAMALFKEANNQNDPDGAYGLGVIYEFGLSVDPDEDKAVNYFKLAAAVCGKAPAEPPCLRAEGMAEYISKELPAALGHLQRANSSDDGKDPFALYVNAILEDTGEVDGMPDKAKAEELYRQSASLGFEPAQKKLAEFGKDQ